jgi:hypothetical protein
LILHLPPPVGLWLKILAFVASSQSPQDEFNQADSGLAR